MLIQLLRVSSVFTRQDLNKLWARLFGKAICESTSSLLPVHGLKRDWDREESSHHSRQSWHPTTDRSVKKSPSSTGFERSQEHASHFLTKYTVTLKPAINSKFFFFFFLNVWNSVTSQHWPDRAIGICFISNPGQLIFLSVKPWLQFHCEFFSNLLKRQAFDWMFCIMSSLTQLSWFCWADLDEFVQIIAPRCSDHLNWDAPERGQISA